MKRIFKSNDRNRLRAGWRILLFLILFLMLASAIFAVKPMIGAITKREFLENYSLIIVSILAVSATIATVIARKFLDKKSFASLGLKCSRQTVKDLVFGFLLSGAMAALFFGLLLGLGLIEFRGFNYQSLQSVESYDFVTYMSILTIGSLALMFLEHVLVGYWEELVFRGYLFQNMIEGLGLVISVVVSCVLYGLIHATNPNATVLSSIIIMGFGYLRIYGYLSTKMLWLSMGMHIGWNFFQGPIFGFAASGHTTATLLTHQFQSDNEYLTGGSFGPEGSILILPILLMAFAVMRWYSRSSRENYMIAGEGKY